MRRLSAHLATAQADASGNTSPRLDPGLVALYQLSPWMMARFREQMDSAQSAVALPHAARVQQQELPVASPTSLRVRSRMALWSAGETPGTAWAGGESLLSYLRGENSVDLDDEPAQIRAALRSLVAAEPGEAPLVMGFEAFPDSILWRGADTPALQAYLPPPELATGAAMIVATGGGFSVLGPLEGDGVAQWLADHGIAAFVLRYRLASEGFPVPVGMEDMRRAVRTVRHYARVWGLDCNRVGVVGVSAGGLLAAAVAADAPATTKFSTSSDPVDHQSCRPDLACLIYPVTDPEAVDEWSADPPTAEQVFGGSVVEAMGGVHTAAEWVARPTGSAPSVPTFLAHSLGDEDLPAVVHSDPYHAALLAGGVDCEYFRADFGAHGCGLVEAWGVPCVEWLAARGFAAAVDDYVYDFADGDEMSIVQDTILAAWDEG